MKFRAPPHCSVVIHGGATLPVAADGSVEAPESEAAHLLAHGIAPWGCTAALPARPLCRPPSHREIEAMPRDAVIAALKKRGHVASSSTRTAELRRALRQALAART